MPLPDLSKAYRCPVTGRFYDPLRAWRDLLAKSAGEVNAWVAAGDEDRLTALAREVLSLPGVDPETGAGFTDAVAFDALGALTEYLAGKERPAQTSPTSAPCTGCP